MTELPPEDESADEVDDLYRRASQTDTSRPSESVRRAVLDHAAMLAAERAPRVVPARPDTPRRTVSRSWRRPAIVGTLATAALAGLMVVPRFLVPSEPPMTASSSAEMSQLTVGGARAPVTTAEPPAQPAPAPYTESLDRLADKKAYAKRALPSLAEVQLMAQRRAAAQVLADSAPGPRQGDRSAQNALTNVPTASGQGERSAQNALPSVAAASGADAAEVDAQRARSATSAAEYGGAADARRVGNATSAAAALPAPQSAGRMSSLMRPPDPATKLRQAAEIGDAVVLQSLLNDQTALNGQAAVDARDASGRTALMLATLSGRVDAVTVLLAHGADPNAADNQGVTPLQAAVAGNQPVIAAALERAGAR